MSAGLVFSNEQVQEYLRGVRGSLLDRTRHQPIALTRPWAKSFIREAGVYAMFQDGYLVYVGETGSLRGRMQDLLDSRHHTLRRNLGEFLFTGHDGYQPATTKRKFPQHIERMVDQLIREQMKISVHSLSLGRKELEEMLIRESNPRFNRKAQRIAR